MAYEEKGNHAMKTANHNTKTRERMSAPTKAVSARKQRRMDKRAALKALANEREHDSRAVKFKALGR